MIRFYDKDVYCIEYTPGEVHGGLNRSELRSFFLKGNQAEIVCVLEEGRYAGYITWPSLLGNDNLYDGIQKEYVILDEMVWTNARHYFARHQSVFGEVVQLPVLNREGELVCFACQDEEADRELRMLRELQACEDALTFCDLNPEYVGATIHGFNELAYYMEKYLTGLGITVNVEGELWKEFVNRENYAMPAHRNYEIWAEGVRQKSGDLQYERLRSVSAEFECVDEIYEANRKDGRISDAEGEWDWLLETLRNEKEIIIIGTDADSQDAYNLLLKNGVDICAFLKKEKSKEKRSLFDKPVLEKTEIQDRFSRAVLIECYSKYSSWGFGEVDHYDCEGYQRNRRYFLLHDYIEVKGENLQYVLQGKNILFVGDADLCSRVWKWKNQWKTGTGKAGYWDLLDECRQEVKEWRIPAVKREEIKEYDLIMLVAPKYDKADLLTVEAAEKYNKYLERLNQHGIYDYSDYFSFISKSAVLRIQEEMTVKKELCPLAVVIGAIPWHSGNYLIKQSFAGHPQVMIIEEYNYLNDNLYYICIRLAEKEAPDILPFFWTLYQKEARAGALERDFPNKEKFIQKMEELLAYGNNFTSQELFIMFHVAYEAMYGRDIIDLSNMVIYWEPHMWERDIVRIWSYWLGGSLKGCVLSTVRNSYIRVGSRIRHILGKKSIWSFILRQGTDEKGKETLYKEWKEIVIRFEDLKKKPREILTYLCEQFHIAFNESLMVTTIHGSISFVKGITGFDLKPVYNLYEEYLTAFDRMRICLLSGIFQKKYGYPFVNSLDFSRRELQEMFLKEFFWERLPEAVAGKDDVVVWMIQKRIREKLWQMRFHEVMDNDELFEFLNRR